MDTGSLGVSLCISASDLPLIRQLVPLPLSRTASLGNAYANSRSNARRHSPPEPPQQIPEESPAPPQNATRNVERPNPSDNSLYQAPDHPGIHLLHEISRCSPIEGACHFRPGPVRASWSGVGMFGHVGTI